MFGLPLNMARRSTEFRPARAGTTPQGRHPASATVSATTATSGAATDDDYKRAPSFLRRHRGQTARRGSSTPPSRLAMMMRSARGLGPSLSGAVEPPGPEPTVTM
ncbi:hypothetical protein THAOC_25030 [Thalassiosira oceanica]|uniref:Uncharacterized protein n=1 Tax=Thalassiosira oceanica TaxID=159749 RepID=K0RSE7_THAOC|nr:hypothetical protein THAOC_25030 [Thalassiosira oceanica]|eukprot:EJK55254.1 hypothetical protein THAOC_25030 [Thalassiosira oceanica]